MLLTRAHTLCACRLARPAHRRAVAPSTSASIPPSSQTHGSSGSPSPKPSKRPSAFASPRPVEAGGVRRIASPLTSTMRGSSAPACSATASGASDRVLRRVPQRRSAHRTVGSVPPRAATRALRRPRNVSGRASLPRVGRAPTARGTQPHVRGGRSARRPHGPGVGRCPAIDARPGGRLPGQRRADATILAAVDFLISGG
jgi:hypothetical protein